MVIKTYAAWRAGEAAARLRLTGISMSDILSADQCGAFQWAQISGYYEDETLRSVFTTAFIMELAKDRSK